MNGRDGAQPTNRRELAYAQLKADILDGTLRPGDPLGEVDLATRIGVSRTPVREALQRLAMEGLVTWVPGRGAFVSGLSVPDIVELFQLREALESHSARLAAASPARATMTEYLGRFADSRTYVADDTMRYFELTAAFDSAVADLAANGRIRIALDEVWAQAARIRRMSNRNMSRIVESIGEHEAIARAIAAGDGNAAAAAAGLHISNSLRNVIESLATQSPNGVSFGRR